MLMAQPTEVEKLTGLASRFGAFVAEQHPFALAEAIDAFQRVATGDESDEAAIEALRPRVQREVGRGRGGGARPPAPPPPPRRPPPPPPPRRGGPYLFFHARVGLLQACDGFL